MHGERKLPEYSWNKVVKLYIIFRWRVDKPFLRIGYKEENVKSAYVLGSEPAHRSLVQTSYAAYAPLIGWPPRPLDMEYRTNRKPSREFISVGRKEKTCPQPLSPGRVSPREDKHGFPTDGRMRLSSIYQPADLSGHGEALSPRCFVLTEES